MKKLMTLLSALLMLQLATAQVSVTASGHVTYENGDPAVGIDVEIYTDTSAVGSVYFNIVQTDASGFYSDTFDAPGGATQGTVYFSVFDCDGTLLTAVDSWSPPQDPTADFVYCANPIDDCSVTIYQDSIPVQSGFFLIAGASGSSPFSYQWNTGENTQNIFVVQSGTYCVTITDNTGCTAEDCFTIDFSTLCSVNIWLTGAGGLTAYTQSVFPVTYSWNTGETTSTIYPTDSGDYCVTVTDDTGCEASDCYYFELPNNNCSVSISQGDSVGVTILQAFSTGDAPFTYVWSNGSTSNYIEVTDDGTYCVTITDASGCTASDCYDYSISNEVCSVYIVCTLAGDLLANTNGVAPFSYLWNTGETTAAIQPIDSGLYCVTITDAVGCTASSCFDFYSQGDTCAVNITIYDNPAGTSADLFAQITAGGQGQFIWSNGAAGPQITVDDAGTYCVTVTTADGCLASDCIFWSPQQQDSCFASIILTGGTQGEPYYFVASPSGQSPFSYVWSDGSIGTTFFPTTDGTYCVSITDASGCVASSCIDFSFPTDTCDVYILEADSTGTSPQLIAVPSGTAPFSYLWNTGDNSPAIIPQTGGTYCVTVTDATGCTADACITVTDPNCFVSITVGQDGILYSFATGTEPFVYDWGGFGNEPNLDPPGPGIYCVTIVDATDCASVSCVDFQPTGNSQIRGSVYPLDSLDTQWNEHILVSLIQFDQAGIPQVIETQELFQSPIGAYYDFGSQPYGDYLVLAELLPDSPNAANYAPTYYISHLWWDDANVITLPDNSNGWYPIAMVPVDGLTGDGEGEVSGTIIDNDELNSEIDEEEKDLTPIEGVTLILLDEFGQPLVYTQTNAFGEYSFQNVPWGTYQLAMEILGHDQAMTWITLGPDSPSQTVDFSVEESGVVITDVSEVISGSSLRLWPNPTNGTATLSLELLEATMVQMRLTSSAGQVMWQNQSRLESGRQTIPLQVEDLPNGLYFVSLYSEDTVHVLKLLKQ